MIRSGPAERLRFGCLGTGLVAIDYLLRDGHANMLGLGGSCGNVLSFLSRFGLPVGCSTRIGLDEAGQILHKALEERSIDSRLMVAEAEGTPMVVHDLTTTDANDQPSYSFACPFTRSPLPRPRTLTPSQADEILGRIGSVDVLYSDRVSPGLLRLAHELRRQGAFVFLEPSDRTSIRYVQSAAAAAHVIKFSGAHLPLNELRSMMLPTPVQILTHGREGVSILCRTSVPRFVHYAAHSVTTVDSAGAGDAFSAAFIASLWYSGAYRSAPDETAVAAASEVALRVAAANCECIGAQGLLSDPARLKHATEGSHISLSPLAAIKPYADTAGRTPGSLLQGRTPLSNLRALPYE